MFFYTFEIIGREKLLAIYCHSHRRNEMSPRLGFEKAATRARPSRLVNKRGNFMQCGQDYAGFPVIFEDLSRSFQPADVGHHEVHYNNVWMKTGRERHRGAAVLCFAANFPPRDSFQYVAQKNSYRRVVIRDKNSQCLHHALRAVLSLQAHRNCNRNGARQQSG
jgi:hypothetical protein